jgi:hypothetical protein
MSYAYYHDYSSEGVTVLIREHANAFRKGPKVACLLRNVVRPHT